MTIDFSQYFDPQHIDKIIRIAVIIVLGSSLIYGISSSVRRSLAKKLSKQSMMLVNRTILYTGFTGLIMLILKELNIELTALLGAAGVVGIVLGVASQTSIGNIISGLFLISEKPFELGDIVRIGDKSGTVYSIDLLSIKIRTFDNLMLRIPNQTVISSDVINVTKFPIRRLDIMIGVAYKEDLRKVQSILENVAKNTRFAWRNLNQ
jgi:small-conductance mechanosensitive channel